MVTLGIEMMYMHRWIDCFIYIEVDMTSLSSHEKKNHSHYAKCWLFRGTLWDLCQTKSAAYFNSMPRKTHLSFRTIIRGYVLCLSYSGKKIHHPLLFFKSFLSILPNSCFYEILRTLWSPALMYSFLFYISNFWADAISKWGGKHTGILFLRQKLKIINISDHI